MIAIHPMVLFEPCLKLVRRERELADSETRRLAFQPPPNDPRQHIVREMVHKLIHRLKLFPAPRTAGNYNASTALGYGWRFIDEVTEIVLSNFLLEQQEQLGFPLEGEAGKRLSHRLAAGLFCEGNCLRRVEGCQM
jgi:hypothetical protein